MGNNQSIHHNISFEDVQQLLTSSTKFLLINTLSTMEQNCLIQGSLHASQEEDTINNFLHLIINLLTDLAVSTFSILII